MQTHLDHNAYSALESDSEESESGELSALLSTPDLDVANSLALADLQEPPEAGGEQRSQIYQPQPAVVDYEQEEEKADFNEGYSPPMNQSPLEAGCVLVRCIVCERLRDRSRGERDLTNRFISCVLQRIIRKVTRSY